MPHRASPEFLFTRLTASTETDSALAEWTDADWRAVLTDLPHDGPTFTARFEHTWDDYIARILECRTEGGDEPLGGYLGVLLLTLQALRHSERLRSASGDTRGHDCDRVCRPLIRDPGVRAALRRLYTPDTPDAEWDNLDFDTLEFHRHGTTSFILTGRTSGPRQGQRPTFALKCIVYPYLRIPTIGRATRDYAKNYDITGHDDLRHLVRVWASSDRWILMDFVAGETLADLLRGQAGDGDELRLDLLDGLGRELFLAMRELERCGLRHGDLSPSNIIVAPSDDTTFGTFKLIDLGVNYLYTHSVTGTAGPDAGYVAPEVRAGEGDPVRADLYSVGQLLVSFGGVGRAADGTVPDGYYAESPQLARFIEDLIDSDPARRLLIFHVDGTGSSYQQLHELFREELEAAQVVRGDRPPHPRWLRGLIDLCRPLLGMPSRQRRLWKLRREQRSDGQGSHVRWLLFWSLVAAGAWYVNLTVVVIWWLRDLNLDWGNQAIAILQRLTGTPEDQFPYLDLLRAEDYRIPDLLNNLPVRMVALSFAIVGARYYQGLFAGITPLATGWRAGGLTTRAVTAEVFMRMGTLVPAVLILPATLIERRWWPLLTAFGVTYTFLANWSSYAFARKAINLAHAHRLSTVPRETSPGLQSFAQWVPASMLYATSVWVIGILIYNGQLRDVFFYAAGATTINIALWYGIKLGRGIAPIRAGLSRACLAAERLRHVP